MIESTISIIIPTFNRAALLQRAIKSCIDQRYKSLEIIVVDDCSSDETEEVVSSFSDCRLVYVKMDVNGGAGLAKNKGASVARSGLITFLDSDDYYYHDGVIDEIVLALGSSDFVAYRSYCIESGAEQRIERSEILGEPYKWLMAHPLHYIGKPPYAMNKTMLLQAGGFEASPRWGEALNLWREMFRRNIRFSLIESVGYVVCIHDGARVSTGSNSGRKKSLKMQFDVLFRSYEAQQAYLQKNPIDRAIWLMILLKKAKSMRDQRLIIRLLKEVASNGFFKQIVAYYLLKSGKVFEG